jgi:hypothetical protein
LNIVVVFVRSRTTADIVHHDIIEADPKKLTPEERAEIGRERELELEKRYPLSEHEIFTEGFSSREALYLSRPNLSPGGAVTRTASRWRGTRS